MAAPSADLLAWLRPREVSVTVAGHQFTLEATTASQWLGAIALDYTDLTGILPGLLREDDLELMAQLADDHPDMERRWRNASRVALGRAGGRDWWWTLNLAKRALSVWIYLNGMLVRQGVRAAQETFPDWLDACYTLLWENGDEQARMKLDLELSALPAGVAVRQSPVDVRRMAQAFAAD